MARRPAEPERARSPQAGSDPPRPDGDDAAVPTVRLGRELIREAAGSSVLFACGGSSELVAHSIGHGWRTPIVAAGFGLGRMAAVPLTRGPVLRVNPAGSVLSFLRGEVSLLMLMLSALVQLAAMTTVAVGLAMLPGAKAAYLLESTASNPRSAVVVSILSLVWFGVLVARPRIGRLGLVYIAIHLIGLPLGGGSLNPARTLAPVLINGRTSGLWAFAAPPLAAAPIVALFQRRRGSR